ncbi:MAG: hypothetical protein CMC15_14070 [Flavobacteriaceae bacterium]|jgi:hypothetical protein|nr:hypothetical protein [Flavobacteriaceae bacterium]|tara:strand:+ start:796 stop:1629 length:834 start_codon:yes stop_codon:yes gene_type:complete
MSTSFSSTVLSDVSYGQKIEADNLRDRFDHLTKKVNGSINKGDILKGSLTTEHIFKPEFYGSPSPYIKGISSDTFYRRRSGNKLDRYYRHEATGSRTQDTVDINELASDVTAWCPIEGLSTTVYLENDREAICDVMTNFYCFESGGKTGTARKKILEEGRTTGPGNEMESKSGYNRARTNTFIQAMYRIFVDTMDGSGPKGITSTLAISYGTAGGRYRYRRMNHSLHCTLFSSLGDITRGENKISVRCVYRLIDPEDIMMRHLYIDQRNLVVDLKYR